jgi:hypothetical protein
MFRCLSSTDTNKTYVPARTSDTHIHEDAKVTHDEQSPSIPKQNSPSTRHGGAWGERRYSSYSFLTPAALCPGEGTPGTHCTGGWVGPRAGLDTEVRGKILCPCRGSNPDHPVRSQTLYWLSYPGSSSIPSLSNFENTYPWNKNIHNWMPYKIKVTMKRCFKIKCPYTVQCQ